MIYSLIRKVLSIAFSVCALTLFAQNPLKTSLKGNSETPYYSPSRYNYTATEKPTVFVSDVIDNRSANWNKQLSSEIKIELIRDFWTFPYRFNLKDKITQDLIKDSFQLKPTKAGADYVLVPSIEVHYPSYFYDPKGYRIYSRINMKVNKEGKLVLEKAYEDNFFYKEGEEEWKDEYHTNYIQGTNYAMWIGMRRLMDLFYADFDLLIQGKTPEKGTLPLKIESINSNIANDLAIIKQEKSYSKVVNDEKVTTKVEIHTDKIEGEPKKNTSVASIKVPEIVETPKPEPIPLPEINKIPDGLQDGLLVLGVKEDKLSSSSASVSNILEEVKKRQVDSLQKAKAAEVKAQQEKAKREKEEAEILAKSQKDKLDSIKKAEMLAIKAKQDEARIKDSLKKAEVNAQLEKAKVEKEKLRLAKLEKDKEIKKAEAEKIKLAKLAEDAKKAEKAKEAEAKKEAELAKAKAEETKRLEAVQAKKVKEEKEALLAAKLKQKNEKIKLAKELVKTKLTTKTKGKIEVSSTDDSKVEVVAIAPTPVLDPIQLENPESIIAPEIPDPTKIDNKYTRQDFIRDSVFYENEKNRKRALIIAAQRRAFERENNKDNAALFRNLQDPPMKVEDKRTREEKLKDRIFEPQNDLSKELLGQTLLIDSKLEKKYEAILASYSPMKRKEFLDSVAIAVQMARKSMPKEKRTVIEPPKKVENSLPTKAIDLKKEIEKSNNESTKSVADKKKELLKNKLDQLGSETKTQKEKEVLNNGNTVKENSKNTVNVASNEPVKTINTSTEEPKIGLSLKERLLKKSQVDTKTTEPEQPKSSETAAPNEPRKPNKLPKGYTKPE